VRSSKSTARLAGKSAAKGERGAERIFVMKRGPNNNHQGTQTEVFIEADNAALEGSLNLPKAPKGIVLFAHGSGSSRHSPRNRYVAQVLQSQGIGTLLFDLMTREEESVDVFTGKLRFDIPFLANRLIEATRWILLQPETRSLPVGYFGASTGAAAALVAAARDASIKAVVSRGGRPDLAMKALPRVKAPTLLIVGGYDSPVIEMNEEAFERLHCEKALKIVPGATHLFEEPGTLEEVVRLARDWFTRHLASSALQEEASTDCPYEEEDLIFANRVEAGRKLAELGFERERVPAHVAVN
jgi:dienelactone hydrolase